MSSFSWTTAFAQPAALTGLVITPDVSTASLMATVTASVAAFHEAYVWEASTEDGDWIEAGRTTDPELDYRVAKFNLLTQLRVKDWNGSASVTGYSEPLEGEATLEVARWWMVHLTGEDTFTQELRYVELGVAVDKGLDQVILEPLSGTDGEMVFPIVITGQRRAERVTLSLRVKAEDAYLIRLIERASQLPVGSIALKDPKGPVYVVQAGATRTSDLGVGHRRVDLFAVRVA